MAPMPLDPVASLMLDEAGPLPARVLVLDDVLATGGTVGAAVRLVNRCGGIVVGVGVVLELDGLGGRTALAGQQIHSLQRVGG